MQTSNKYYLWWKQNKLYLSLVPAVVFWVVSMIFFVVGLKFKNGIVIGGFDVSTFIAFSLSISNTIIQIIGNDQEEELGTAMYLGWIGSYLLGIGTNVVGLTSILDISNVYIEYAIAIGLGTVIEVMPERLLVAFLKGFNGTRTRYPQQQRFSNQHQQQNQRGNNQQVRVNQPFRINQNKPQKQANPLFQVHYPGDEERFSDQQAGFFGNNQQNQGRK